MPVTITATPGDPAANSYETLTEFQTYLGLRLQLPATVSALLTADPDEKLPKALLMATRHLDQILTRFKRLEVTVGSGKVVKFYVIRPYWTGTPATTTQSLAWPRIGMFDANGNAIGQGIIPEALKNAESEMAILEITTDVTADNQVIAQGLTSVKAGPVALTFKDFIQKRILPDAVYMALVSSWLTDETFENVPQAQFRTIGPSSGRC